MGSTGGPALAMHPGAHAIVWHRLAGLLQHGKQLIQTAVSNTQRAMAHDLDDIHEHPALVCLTLTQRWSA